MTLIEWKYDIHSTTLQNNLRFFKKTHSIDNCNSWSATSNLWSHLLSTSIDAFLAILYYQEVKPANGEQFLVRTECGEGLDNNKTATKRQI